MTFLHKLAKRLALIPAAVVGSISLVASCGERAHDYLGPDPSKPNPSGTYIGLSVTPHDPQLVLGDSVRLEARAWLPSGLSVTASVNWTAQGGIVSGSGWFRPSVTGSFLVRAVSTTNPALSDSTLVTVIAQGGIARIDITPAAAPLAAGTRQQFTAVALMGDGSRMFPTVAWSATGGSISSNGLFTASGEQGGYTVTASIGEGTLLGETAGIVNPAVLTGLALDPAAVMMESGSMRQFMPYASWSDGSNSSPALTWTATGGFVTSSGVYTAGNTPGSYRVIASSALGKADTANVTILPRIVAIRLSPLTALLALEATQGVQAYALRNDGSESPVGVDWVAEGGIITLDGTYSAGTTAGNYAIIGTLATLDGRIFSDTAHFEVGADEATAVSIFVAPDTTVVVGSKVQFFASSGGTTVPAVTWSATGGSIDSKGLYSAGSIPGDYKVIGKRKNQSKADTANVVIKSQPALAVSGFTISPQSDIIGSGQTRQFSATLNWNDGAVHPANISWVSAGGTITQNGLYTAGSIAGTYLIIATCSCGVSDTASVSIPVTAAAPITLSTVSLSPATVQLAPGDSKQFVISATWSDGSTAVPSVSFVAEGGSITQSGQYVAGNLAGSYRVIATQAGGGKADTSVVTVTDGSVATLTQLVLNPSAVTVPVGATQSFVVSASWSDGSTTVPPVTYSATGGTVSTQGIYTAGTTAGTFRLIASHTGGTKADTSVITIPSAAVTLTQISLNPSTSTLAPGATQQFVATGTWSDGSTLAPTVTYSATGGSVTPGGLYTAGTTAGTYRVIAVQTGGTKADTSAITISTTPPPPTGSLPVTLPAAVANWIGPLTPAAATPAAFARYETDFATYEALRWAADSSGGGVAGAGCKANTQFDFTDYYDRAYALYQMWARTGNPTYRSHADAIVKCYRDGYLAPAGFHAQPHNWQVEGLAIHYWLTGDVASKNALLTLVRDVYAVFAASNLVSENYVYWEGRIQARLLLGALLAKQLGDQTRNWGAVADSLATMSAALQHADGSYKWPSFVSTGQGNQANFMVGLLNYAFGQYHRHQSQNAQVLSAVKKSLDYLWSTQWCGSGFNYTNIGPCSSTSVAADLTGLLVYGWGFYASVTGDMSYQTIGDQIFAKGITGAYLVQQKQFNQQYRETSLYLGLRR